MPGRNPAAALRAYVDPIQRAVNCIARAAVSYGQAEAGVELALGLPVFAEIRLGDGRRARLRLGQQFMLVETTDRDRGPWKASTRKYRYHIDIDGDEAVSWHWHPPGDGLAGQPHLHTYSSPQRRWHLPTGRVSIESVVRFAIEELGVEPLTAGWSDVLAETEGAFQQWATWRMAPIPGPPG